MNLREALLKRKWFKFLYLNERDTAEADFDVALRAAYHEGYSNGLDDALVADRDRFDESDGVAAGVAALTEGETP